MTWCVGDECEALWTDGHWYYAVVEAADSGNFRVAFPQFNEEFECTVESLRPCATQDKNQEHQQDTTQLGVPGAQGAKTKKRRASVWNELRPTLTESTIEPPPFLSRGDVSKLLALPSQEPTEGEVGENEEKGLVATYVPHLSNLVMQGFMEGVGLLKGFREFIRKIVDMENHTADLLIKTSNAARERRDSLLTKNSLFGLSKLVGGILMVQSYFTDLVCNKRQFAAELEEKIITPINNFVQQHEPMIKTMMQAEDTGSRQLHQATVECVRLHLLAQKAWVVLCKHGDSTDNATVKKMETALRNCTQRFEKFEEHRKAMYKLQEKYLEESRERQNECEKFEHARMQVILQALQDFEKLEQQYLKHEDLSRDLRKHIGSINLNQDFRSRVNSLLQIYGPCPEYIPPPYCLPCESSALEDGTYKGAADYLVVQEQLAEEEKEKELTRVSHQQEEEEVAKSKTETKGIFSKVSSGLNVTNVFRGLVSKKKKRFKEDGYDLDLTYITPKIIAMGFPSEKLAGVYRNPMPQVQKFLNERHKDSYKVYNLCAEIEYDTAKFDNRCARYPFMDHNPCCFHIIKPFCEDVSEFLNLGLEEPCVAIHCKAGKGRTGFLISCYLLHSGMCATATHALKFYANARTHNRKGVTIPSQIRYVHYYERFLKEPPPASRPLTLKHIVISGLPVDFLKHPESVQFSLVAQSPGGENKVVIDGARDCAIILSEARDCAIIGHGKDHLGTMLDKDLTLCFSSANIKFSFWINTAFLPPPKGARVTLVLPKAQVDKARKDTHHEQYPPYFQVKCVFGTVNPGEGGQGGGGGEAGEAEAGKAGAGEGGDGDLGTKVETPSLSPSLPPSLEEGGKGDEERESMSMSPDPPPSVPDFAAE